MYTTWTVEIANQDRYLCDSHRHHHLSFPSVQQPEYKGKEKINDPHFE